MAGIDIDEKFLLFMKQTFDIALMHLHCVNNLSSVLLNVSNVFRKDGLFIGIQVLNELQ